MKVPCPRCKSEFQVPGELMKRGVAHAVCDRCGFKFVVRLGDPGSTRKKPPTQETQKLEGVKSSGSVASVSGEIGSDSPKFIAAETRTSIHVDPAFQQEIQQVNQRDAALAAAPTDPNAGLATQRTVVEPLAAEVQGLFDEEPPPAITAQKTAVDEEPTPAEPPVAITAQETAVDEEPTPAEPPAAITAQETAVDEEPTPAEHPAAITAQETAVDEEPTPAEPPAAITAQETAVDEEPTPAEPAPAIAAPAATQPQPPVPAPPSSGFETFKSVRTAYAPPPGAEVRPPTPPVPVQPAPQRPVPVQPAPQQPVPVQPAPQQPVPVQPAPQQPVPFQPAPQQPVPFQPAPQQPVQQPYPQYPGVPAAAASGSVYAGPMGPAQPQAPWVAAPYAGYDLEVVIPAPEPTGPGRGMRALGLLFTFLVLVAAIFFTYVLYKNDWSLDLAGFGDMVDKAFGGGPPPEVADELRGLEIDQPERPIVEQAKLADGQPVLTVQGVVKNNDTRPRRYIYVQATLKDNHGRTIVTTETPAGNVFSVEQLSKLSRQRLASSINPGGRDGSNARVESGSSVAYMVVITKVPLDYTPAKYRVFAEVSQAELYEGP